MLLRLGFHVYRRPVLEGAVVGAKVTLGVVLGSFDADIALGDCWRWRAQKSRVRGLMDGCRTRVVRAENEKHVEKCQLGGNLA